MFGCIKANPKIKLCFDPQHPKIDERSFAAHDWYDLYRDAKYAILSDAPTPRVNMVYIYCSVDDDQSGNIATRISHTGVLIFVNKDPIIWYSKRQNTVKTSTF